MSEDSMLPPELPSTNAGRISTVISWIAIIASVVFLAWTANNPPEAAVTEPRQESVDLMPIDDANELAMLKMQGRFIVGIARYSPMEASRSIRQLEAMIKTARGRAALAVIQNFIDSDKGLEKGLEIVDEIDGKIYPGLKEQIVSALENGVDDAGREKLEKQIGWFSQLVASTDPAVSKGLKESVIEESTKSMLTMIGFFSIVFLAGLSGVGLLVFFVISLSSGATKMRYQPADGFAKKHIFLESFAIYIGIMALGHLLAEKVSPDISIIAYAGSFLLAVFWPVIRGVSWKQSCQLIGLNRGTGFFRELGAGVVGYLGIIIFAVIGLIGTLIVIGIFNLIQGGDGVSAGETSHPIVGMLDASESIVGKLMLLFLAAGLAPFLEETMFRGALFRFMRNGWGFILSSVIGGVIFAIIHPQGIFALPALCSMGVGFALLREWRDSLIASMTAHALNNGAIVLLLLLVMT